jgi:Beta-ketoacyl synthase, N-terminal domain
MTRPVTEPVLTEPLVTEPVVAEPVTAESVTVSAPETVAVSVAQPAVVAVLQPATVPVAEPVTVSVTPPITAAAPVLSLCLDELHAAALLAGLTVSASASWPEADDGDEVTPLAGFIESTFSPLIAEVSVRALERREQRLTEMTTAIVIVTALGDTTSAARVATAVDSGGRVFPLLFFQSVPNAIAGYLAARWNLTGPVVCVSGTTAGLDVAALLIEDGDADAALVVRADLATSGGEQDRAAAILVTGQTGGLPR